MTGYVHTINRRRGLVAIQTDSCLFTIVEMTGSDPINLGDRIEWHTDALGSTSFFNLTKGAKVAVNVYAHGVLESRVRSRLKL